MRTLRSTWTQESGWADLPPVQTPPSLVLIFGTRAQLDGPALGQLAEGVPRDRIFGCSTAGQIDGTCVVDDAVVATSVWFDRVHHVAVSGCADGGGGLRVFGEVLARRLPVEGLTHALVFCDGTRVNGAQLIDGLVAGLPAGVTVSGGLAGDGESLAVTTVVHEGVAATGLISVLGLYGPLRVRTGTLGGWIPFGPSRRVTASTGGVLRQFDGESALDVYKRYLGPFAAGLPRSGLLFPLLIEPPQGTPVARLILDVDHVGDSVTFAGDIPVGSTARMMHASLERLIEGATGAAKSAFLEGAPLALVVSCVGRRMVLKQRTEEELEAVREVLGEGTTLAGFYSYGELAPAESGQPCRLHNHYIAITTFAEAA